MDDFAASGRNHIYRPYRLPLTVGYGQNGPDNIHDFLRPGGADCWLLEYTLAGQVQIRGKGGKKVFGKGTLICFPPGIPHDYGMEGFWHHYWITFQPRDNWTPLLSWPSLDCGVLYLEADDERSEKAVDIFEELLDMKSRLLNRKREMIMNRLENLLLNLDMVNPLAQKQSIDPRIRKVLEVMRMNFRQGQTIGQLAALSHLSESRFCHLFKSQMHCTPMQYLEKYRVERACELLQMGSDPVSAVAENCGYDDPLYFSRIFRKHMRLSPRDFRKG